MQSKIEPAFKLDPNDPNVQGALAQQAQWKANPTDLSPQMGVGNTESSTPLNVGGTAAMNATPSQTADIPHIPSAPQITSTSAVPPTSSSESPPVVPKDKSSGLTIDLSPLREARAAADLALNEAHRISVGKAVWEGFNEGISHYTDQLAKPYFKYVEGRSEDEIQSMVQGRNAEFRKAQKDHSTAFAVGQFAGDVGAFSVAAGATAAGGMGAISGSIAQGAALGLARAPEGDETRVGNAVQNAAIFGGISAAGAGLVAGGRKLFGIGKDASKQINQAADLGIDLNVMNVSESPAVKGAVSNIVRSLPLSGDVGVKAQQSLQLEPGIRRFADAVAEGTHGNPASIAEAIRSRYTGVKATAGKLFDQVDSLASKSGSNHIPLSETRASAVSLLNDPSISNSVKTKLGDFIKRVPENGSMTYAQARQLRTTIGRELTHTKNGYKAGNTEVGTNDPVALTKMFNSIHKDIDDWAVSSAPDVAKAYSRASGYYQAMNHTFTDNHALMKAIEDRSSLQKFASKMFNDSTPEVLRANKTLVKGVMPAVRSNMISSALNKSLDRSNPQMPVNIAKFIDELRKPGDEGVKLIWGKQYDNLIGLEKSLRSIDHGMKQGTVPASMKAFIATSLAAGGGILPAMGVPVVGPAVAAVMIPLYTMSKLVTSPKTAKMLSHWNRISPGAPTAVRSNLMKQTLSAFKETLIDAPMHSKIRLSAYEANQYRKGDK